MQPIEGITPGALWTTAGVAVALLGVAILVFKLVEFVQGQQDRKKAAKDDPAERTKLAEDISRKVTDELEPRLSGIEEDVTEIKDKLRNDKARLDSHEQTMQRIADAQRDSQDGFAALAGALVAVLDHELHNGNTSQMTEARDELTRYLTHRR